MHGYFVPLLKDGIGRGTTSLLRIIDHGSLTRQSSYRVEGEDREES